MLVWRREETVGEDTRFLVCKRPDFVGFSANISNRSSIVRYGFWCFGFGVCGVGGQVIGAVSVHVGTIFGVGTGRRDGFGAMTGREAISAQDIGFRGVAGLVGVDCFGVAGGVKGSELSKVVFGWSIGGASINVGSLGVGVAGGVGIAATGFGVGSAGSLGVRSAGFASGVEGGVIGADAAVGVVSAGSVVVISAGSAFGVEGVVGKAVSLGVVFAGSLVGFFWW